ncbi:hypothetical protein D3C72_2142920 [compost metagenome]
MQAPTTLLGETADVGSQLLFAGDLSAAAVVEQACGIQVDGLPGRYQAGDVIQCRHAQGYLPESGQFPITVDQAGAVHAQRTTAAQQTALTVEQALAVDTKIATSQHAATVLVV